MFAKLTKVSANHGGPSVTSAIQRDSTGGGPTAGKNPIDVNPINQFFEIGPEVASAGPELVWKIHAARRRSDRRVRGKQATNLMILPDHTFLSRFHLHPHAPASSSSPVRGPRHVHACHLIERKLLSLHHEKRRRKEIGKRRGREVNSKAGTARIPRQKGRLVSPSIISSLFPLQRRRMRS